MTTGDHCQSLQRGKQPVTYHPSGGRALFIATAEVNAKLVSVPARKPDDYAAHAVIAITVNARIKPRPKLTMVNDVDV